MFAWTSVSCAGSKKSDGFQQISSPNGRVSVKVTDGYFVVLYDDVEVQTVKIGNGTFKDCYFTKEPKENNYSLISGKRSECSYSYNQMFYVGENGTPIPITITFSVTDNGVAFSFNGSDESIAYVIPDGTKRWMQQLKTDYEGFYPMSTSAKRRQIRISGPDRVRKRSFRTYYGIRYQTRQLLFISGLQRPRVHFDLYRPRFRQSASVANYYGWFFGRYR